jgi:hypothetical protein
MNEYQITTKRGLEYVRAEGYRLSKGTATFISDNAVVRIIYHVEKVEKIDPRIVASWKPEGGRAR